MKNLTKNYKLFYAISISIIVFIIYILTLSENLSSAHDSIIYIQNIDTGHGLFHPHHLLYNWFNHTLIRLFNIKNSVIFVEIINSLFGAGALLILFFLLYNSGLNTFFSASGVLLFGFSFGIWYYNVCVETYSITIFFIISLLYIYSFKPFNIKTAAICGLLNALAVLFHEMSIFLSLVIIITVYFSNYKSSLKIKFILSYIISISLFISIPYLFVVFYFIKPHSLYDAVYWFTSYAHTNQFAGINIKTIPLSIVGFLRSIFGLQFLFAMKPINGFISNTFSNHFLLDEFFLVRNYSALKICFLFFSVLIISLFLIINILKYIFKNLNNSFVLLLFIWIIVYSVFTAVYEPSNLKYWIFILPPVWILFVYICAKKNNKKLMFLIVILLFLSNFLGNISALSNKKNDYYYQLMMSINNNYIKDDIILVPREWVYRNYLERFVNGKWMFADKELETYGSFEHLYKELNNILQKNHKIIIPEEFFNIEQKKDILNYVEINKLKCRKVDFIYIINSNYEVNL